MKIFVTGSTGFIGRNFIKKYSNQYEFVVLSKNPNLDSKSFSDKNITIENGLIEDSNVINTITKHKPDVIVHLASLTGVQICEKNPDEAFKINVDGTINVIKACSTISSKIIFLSSREVYGESKNTISNEEDPLIPTNVYGLSKMVGEILVRSYSKKNNFDFTILRPTNIYGPGSTHGIYDLIKNAILDKKIKLFGGKQLLNLIYVDDVIEVINHVLTDKRSSGQIFNVGSNDTITIEELAKMVSEILDERIEFEHLPMRKGDSQIFNPDLQKINSVLGFSSKTSLENGLKNTINWVRETL